MSLVSSAPGFVSIRYLMRSKYLCFGCDMYMHTYNATTVNDENKDIEVCLNDKCKYCSDLSSVNVVEAK